jgi:predicted metal-dependent phosphoesterase TrpH
MTMLFDLHMHTKRHSPDSSIDPFALVRRAQEIGLDGVVITEHDWLWTEEELAELRAAAPGLVVLAGIEVSTKDGDTLVYGVSDPFALPAGIRMAACCREVHKQGGAAVAAHPYRWGQDFDRILRDMKPELDGIEMMSNNMDDGLRRKAADLSRRQPHLATLGNSDAHEVGVLGRCVTAFDADIRDNQTLVEAIRGRKATAMPRGAVKA